MVEVEQIAKLLYPFKQQLYTNAHNVFLFKGAIMIRNQK